MGIQLNAPIRAVNRTARQSATADQKFEELTQNERLVHEALCRSKTPQKAYDLLDRLQEHGLRAPMTIYRALDALIAKGRVRKIESLNAFIAVRPGRSDQARAFLICKECQKAKEITLDKQKVANLFSPLPVSVDDIRIEAFGECHQVCGEPG